LSDPYQGGGQHDPAKEKAATDAFWEALRTGANLSEEERRALNEKTMQFMEAVAWFKENSMIVPPHITVRLICEVRGFLEHLGYKVDLDPGPMPD
jgi:hypothetical protein